MTGTGHNQSSMLRFLMVVSICFATAAPAAAEAENSRGVASLFGRWARELSNLDCDDAFGPDSCMERCGYAGEDAAGVRCVGSPARFGRLTAALDARWGVLEPHLLGEARAGRRLAEVAACLGFLGRNSPELAAALAAAAAAAPLEHVVFAVLARQILDDEPGANSWLVTLAASEPVTLQQEHEIRRLLEAAVVAEALPASIWPHIARRHPALLPSGPPDEVMSVVRDRLTTSRQVAERETLALHLGAMLRFEPGRLSDVVELLDSQLGTIALTEAVRHRERETPAAPEILRAWLALMAGAGGSRALEHVASRRARFPLCALAPSSIEDPRAIEGALRYLFQPPVGRFAAIEVCDSDAQIAWAVWLARHRSSPLVDRGMLLRLPDRLGYDALERFEELSYPVDDRYQGELATRWCRRLERLGSREDRARAITEMVDRAAAFGPHGLQSVLSCGSTGETSADLWSPPLARLLARLPRESFISAMPFVERVGIRGQEGTSALLEAVRAYSREHGRDLGVRLSALLCEHALTPGSIDALVRALELLDEAELDDLIRYEAREILIDGLFGAVGDPSWRQRLLDELDAALRRLDGDLSAPTVELLEEVRRVIERREPFVFSA